MDTIIGSTMDISTDAEYEDEPILWLQCPFCACFKEVTGDPYESYGSFQVSCDQHEKDENYMGIELGEPMDTAPDQCLDQNLTFWYRCKVLEFSHYPKKQNYHYDTDEFKELEQRWLKGDYVWEKFDPPRYCLSEDRCYNQTFLTHNGQSEFHFGFD